MKDLTKTMEISMREMEEQEAAEAEAARAEAAATDAAPTAAGQTTGTTPAAGASGSDLNAPVAADRAKEKAGPKAGFRMGEQSCVRFSCLLVLSERLCGGP